MQSKYYLIPLISLFVSLNLSAQREKKLEHLLTIDTANVTLQDTRKNSYPFSEKTPHHGDTVIKKHFHAGKPTGEPDYDWRYEPVYEYERISLDEKRNHYTLYPAYEGFVPKRAHFEFSTKLSTGWVNRLPKRQNRYGQNDSPNEIFSWGNPVNTSYDPYALFRPSFGEVSSLSYATPLFNKKGSLALQYGNTTNRGVIPEACSGTNVLKLELNTPFPLFFDRFGAKFNYLETYSDLTENGSSYARLFYNIAATPPDFDNSRGGFSGSKAFTNVDGSEHQYANSVDNPYRYIANSLDKEFIRKASAAFSLANKSWFWMGGYDYARQHIRSGIMPYEPAMTGNANGRNEQFKTLNSALQYRYSSDYRHDYNRRLEYTLKATYNLSATNYSADYTQLDHLSLSRITNDLGVSLNGNYSRKISADLWLNANHSNTLNKTKVYLNEGLNMAVHVGEMPFFSYSDLSDFLSISTLKLRYSLAHTQNEAPLYFTQPHYGSTQVKAQDFRDYQEQYPLYAASGLGTEKTLRNEIGADFDFGYGRHFFEVNYFWNKTTGGILPVYQNNRFELTNAVDWNKRGLEFAYNYSDDYHYSEIGLDVFVNLTAYQTAVKRLLMNENQIPLSGFSDVSVSVLEGQPYGVIYGQKTDGTMGVIGDPTPDFTLNVNPKLRWKEFALECLVGYVHGGDCWNGTRNTMNYLGVSQESAQNRIAQIPSESPYYPSGITGIAADAVEDASTVRFHTITLSYDVSKKVEIPQLILSLGLNNLIVWSAYSGVDAARPLFGYSAAQGLDYFNMPGTTNVTFAVKMRF